MDRPAQPIDPRRADDAERLAHREIDAGRWDGPTARWFVLAHEALAAEGRRAWMRTGAPRRRAGDTRQLG